MNREIAGSLILYYPDFGVVKNVRSYINFIDKLYIIDNSESQTSAHKKIVDELKCIPKKIHYIANNKNLGIATALNAAAQLAFSENYTWLLTMDQDSYFSSGMAELYFKCFNRVKSRAQLAIVTPSHFKPDSPLAADSNRIDDFDQPLFVMTSGNLLNLKLFQSVGPFDESLFIDEVDHDYCLRANLRGLEITRFINVGLVHPLGNSKQINWFGKQRTARLYTPKRFYYMVRNNLYLWKKYKVHFPEFIANRKQYFQSHLLFNLIYGEKPIQTCFQAVRGFIDFLRGRFGS